MLEAVNSVLQTAPLIRSHAEQVSPVDSYGGNPERLQKIAQAPYISPFIYMDIDFDKAVLQIRDSSTGDVVRQIPSEASLEARRRDLSRDNAVEQTVTVPESREESAQAFVQETSLPQGKQTAVSTEQIKAFEAASRAGNSNAGNVTLFA